MVRLAFSKTWQANMELNHENISLLGYEYISRVSQQTDNQ